MENQVKIGVVVVGIGPIQPVVMDGLRLAGQSLLPGQVVRLQLMEFGTGSGIVSLNGNLFRATGVLPSRPGELFWAIIEQINKDQIRVRHVSPATAGSRGVALPDLARALGLPDAGQTGAVLRELLRWNLPVSRETIQSILSEMRALPEGERAAYLTARAWLMTLALPDQSSAVNRMLAYLLGRPNADPGGQELLNRAPTKHPEVGNLYAFSLNGGERFQGSLYLVLPGAKGSEMGSDPARLVLDLETPTFGAFWVLLELLDGQMTGKIILPDDRFLRIFRSFLGDLERRLREVGFTVHGLTVRTGSIGSVADLLGVDPKDESYMPLDIRV